MSEALALFGNTQVISQLRENQNIEHQGKKRTLKDYFNRNFHDKGYFLPRIAKASEVYNEALFSDFRVGVRKSIVIKFCFLLVGQLQCNHEFGLSIYKDHAMLNFKLIADMATTPVELFYQKQLYWGEEPCQSKTLSFMCIAV